MTKSKQSAELTLEEFAVPQFKYNPELVAKHADIERQLKALQADFEKSKAAVNTKDAGAMWPPV